ncbi:glycine--tRNA ligase subunit alpha, partial [Clostridioides difficile]|uniref:glycine--tRNA ligase subunit alpha n=1 Tax=Clostridioides difficile TaxID=1496 RepID=UPI003F8D43A5
KEALRLMENGLVIPSYDYVLKCSHAFNTLDARGAIGVSQRASFYLNNFKIIKKLKVSIKLIHANIICLLI